MTPLRPRFPSLLALAACLASPAYAQVPDSVSVGEEGIAPAMGRCILRWRPLESGTRSFTNRDIVGEHVTHLSGRYLWTCGSATMEADSAIKRDGPHQVELIGSVVYEDTIRTLKSGRLLYFQLSDFIIAEEEVELLRLGDRSTLTGPRVEFLRAVSGVDAFTTAPGRPTVTFYSERDESGEPFVVEADAVVFAGEDEARFAGNAVIARSDLNARADTAYLTREDGVGLLWGDPWIEAEGIRLEGDTIRFRSQGEELEAVQALGAGYASGENFSVRAEAIDVALANREVEQVWAHGEGVGEAASGPHTLYGDSLHFVMYRSQIDTVYAFGEAVAIQRDTAFVPPEAPQESEEEVSEDEDTGEGGGEDAVEDEDEEEGGGEAEEDEEGAQDEEGDGEDGSAEDEEAQAAEAEAEGPELALDGSMNWARADTLVAIFDRPGAADAAAAGAAVPDSAGTAEPAMSKLTLAGGASALYRMVRDSAATSRPSRNYLVGLRIEVDFEAGAPFAVTGEHAIGVYLEPRETFGETEEEAPSDSSEVAEAAADSVAAAPSDTSAVAGGAPADSTAAVPADSARAQADTVSAPPDTVSASPDTASAPPDTASAPPDTASAPPDTVRNAPLAATPAAPLLQRPSPPARRTPDAAHRTRRIA